MFILTTSNDVFALSTMRKAQNGLTVSIRGKMSSTKPENIEEIILKSINEGVITIDCSGVVSSSNPSVERILGIEAKRFIAQHYEALLGEGENPGFRAILSRLIEQGHQTSHSEIIYSRPDGQTVNIAVSTSALDMNACFDNMETFVVVIRDITAFKALEKVRKKAVNHLAHELATPISVIQASITGIKQAENLSEKSKRHLGRVERNLERLINIENIVEQILYPVHAFPARFKLGEVFGRIFSRIRNDSDHRQIELIFPQTDSVFDRTDPGTLEIIIDTLVKNAIENTPDGGLVEVQLTDEETCPVLSVSDTGIGISLENQNFIFEGFHHTQETDDYATRKPYDFNAGGKGLELLRLKAIAETQGFDLSFTSSRCIHIPMPYDLCPGNIELCKYVRSREECFSSGGSTFYVKFS